MQLEAPPAAWVEDSHPLAQPGPGHADGELEVRVVRDHDGHLVVLLEAIHQQVGSEIDIGALFFGVEYLNRARTWSLAGQRPPLRIGKEVSVVQGHCRNGLQGAKVSLLPLGLRWIVGAAGNQGGKVSYAAYLVVGQQKPHQLTDVQPSVGRAAQGAVIEIEAVDIDVGADGDCPYKKLRLPRGSLAPCRRGDRGCMCPRYRVAGAVVNRLCPGDFTTEGTEGGSCGGVSESGFGG